MAQSLLLRCCWLALAIPAGPPVQAQQPTGSQAASTPSSLKLSGTFRVRYEALDGQFRPGLDAKDDLVSLRTTLLAEYKMGSSRFGAELYDSRAYGGQAGSAVSANDVNALELVQAYVAADLADALGGNSNAAVQIGRFTLNLGSRRLVAADDYRNTTNGFTGIRGDYRSKAGMAATLIYVLPQLRLPDDLPSVLDNDVQFDKESFNLSLWGGVVSHAEILDGAVLEATYLRLIEKDSSARPTRDRRLHSVGARIIREPAANRVDFELEAIHQFGSISSGAAPAAATWDVSAHFVHAEAGYSFGGRWKPKISVEYDHASGDAPGGRYGRFDTLYGMRRADLAPSGIYAALGRTNISTPGIRLEVSPAKPTDAFISYRALWAAEAADSFSTTGVSDPAGASGRFAGHQVEGRIRHWLVPQRLRGEINAAWLMKQGLLDDAPNAPSTKYTTYVSVAATANF